MAEIVRLSEDRIESLDHDATAAHAVVPVVDAIRRLVPARKKPRLLDVGGGNGAFLDSMIRAMPEASGTLVEMSPTMVPKKVASNRKAVVCANFLDWVKEAYQGRERYDVVFFNFVLHHFVGQRRRDSILLQRQAIEAAKAILAEGGLVVVYEIHYNGLFQDELPSKLIHALSESKVLAPLTKQMGANTAGYGVCFHSEKFWRSLFGQSGLRVAHEHTIVQGSFAGLKPRIQQVLLTIATMDYRIHSLRVEGLS